MESAPKSRASLERCSNIIGHINLPIPKTVCVPISLAVEWDRGIVPIVSPLGVETVLPVPMALSGAPNRIS